jgi:mRNA interferase MazF
MRRGEIWLINLDPTIGAEIKKTRPVVIVSSDEVGILPLRVIVPLTDWKPRYVESPWMVQVTPDDQNGLLKPSACDAFQVRSVSVDRFSRKVGSLSARTLRLLTLALAEVLEIE